METTTTQTPCSGTGTGFAGRVRQASIELHAALDADEPARTRQALQALNVLDRDTAQVVWGRIEAACRHLENAVAWCDDPFDGECWNDAEVSEQFYGPDGEFDAVAAAGYAVEYWEQQLHGEVVEAARTVAWHRIPHPA